MFSCHFITQQIMEKKIYSSPETSVIMIWEQTSLLSGSEVVVFSLVDVETEDQI